MSHEAHKDHKEKEKLLEMANEKLARIEILFATSNLPNASAINVILVEMRKKIYN
jgi:hypothetical protein